MNKKTNLAVDAKKAKPAQPFPEEQEHLAHTLAQLDSALESAEETVGQMEARYRETKRYMAENRGELDPHEMFQNELGLRDIDASGAFAVEMRDRLVKLRESPYFARIDFVEKEEPAADIYYIGRFTFTWEGQPRIFDWRAPIASLFYDYEPGPAAYTAPRGRVEGVLARKRQLHIANGRLEYALDNGAHIRDEVLGRELAHTSDEGMRSIISTIQREQNAIIRDETGGTIIIQGVAGSGKTSVALHRVAYLLYRYKDSLRAQNVTIISPNKVFGSYIAGVLPELGEEPIFQVSMADIARVQLEGIIGFEEEKDPLEAMNDAWATRARAKATPGFLRQLEEYAQEMANTVFRPADYRHGDFCAGAEWISARYSAYQKYPVLKRLERVAEDIRERFATENKWGDELPRQRTILKNLKAMLAVKSTLPLYRAFFQKLGQPALFRMAGPKTLEWEDVYPFLRLHAAFAGLEPSGVIRHLVIDEMQDYTPVQYAVLNCLFPCPKTVLGDFGQQVHPLYQTALEEMRLLYPAASFVELNTSYRSTWEIIQFARRFTRDNCIRPIERHGDTPAVVRCQTTEKEYQKICWFIEEVANNRNTTMGILTKTAAEADALYQALRGNPNVHLVTRQSQTYQGGVTITTVRMAKGLEFDEVLLPGTHQYTIEDYNLLYVACTRAMHRLTLLYSEATAPEWLVPNEMTDA